MKIKHLVLFSLILLISGCVIQENSILKWEEVKSYDVVIERDYLGVPHIIGKTDEDAAFGFAYAQAEDNWKLIHDSIPFYRGTSAAINGIEGATTDYLIHWLEIWETIESLYESELSDETKSYLDAFVDGLNFYAMKHPEVTNEDLFPITPQDIVAGYMVRHLLFYGFESYVSELFEEEQVRPISESPTHKELSENLETNGVIIDNLPVGSNAIAVNAPFTSDDATRLAINSHQPTTGPVAWYEAHIQSEEGLNIMGGLFPSSPTIGVGFNENLAWGATVNKPDLVDIFALTTNTKESDKYNYLLDGESFDGTAAQFNLNRNTEKWETKYRFETKSPEFRTDLGFTTENNWLAHELSQSYQYRSNNFIRKANMGGSISLLTNYDNNILDQEAELFFNADFSNQINLDLGVERSNKATFEGFAFHNIDSFRTGVRYNPSGKFFIRF